MTINQIAILEFSEGLGEYFTKYLEPEDYKILPVWVTGDFPDEDYIAYIITGDYNNISDGLLPIHNQETEFLKSIRDKKVFCSCFSHQLMSLAHGGKVGKREHRFLGWQKIEIRKSHPIFKGLEDFYFLCLNVDEITEKSDNAEVLATNPDCEFQVLQYSENVLTFQSHPEVLKVEGLDAIKKHRESLLNHCPDLDQLVEQTKNYANDNKNKIFLMNLFEWLLS